MANKKRLIDANALFRRLQKRREDFASAWKTFDAMPIDAQIQYHENLECSLIAEDLPIVDAVEVVHAKAVPIYSNIEYEDTLIRMDSQCPLCSALMLRADNYCPDCGAKMDGDGNG